MEFRELFKEIMQAQAVTTNPLRKGKPIPHDRWQTKVHWPTQYYCHVTLIPSSILIRTYPWVANPIILFILALWSLLLYHTFWVTYIFCGPDAFHYSMYGVL